MNEIRTNIFYHKLYAIIAALGIMVISFFVPEKKQDILPAFYFMIIFAVTITSAIMSAILAWIQENDLKRLVAKEIEDQKSWFDPLIKKMEKKLIYLSFCRIRNIRKNPMPYINAMLPFLENEFNFNDINSTFTQEVLKDEFIRRMKQLLRPIPELTELNV